MNLILLFPEDYIEKKSVVRLTGRRLKHIQEIFKAKVSDDLTVGLVNGKIGKGRVTLLKNDRVELEVSLNESPPPHVPVTLICALPRPPVVRKVLQSCASLGIKKIIFLNFNRVEKSLWQSSSLKPNAIKEELVLGLEQSKDTMLPDVFIRPRFKPFVEDELPQLMKGSLALAAHPEAVSPCPRNLKTPVTLMIGPEGGFVPYEVEKLQSIGFKMFHLGPRILKVETVIPYILGQLSS